MACLKLLSFELSCLRFKDETVSDIGVLLEPIVLGSCHIVHIHFYMFLFILSSPVNIYSRINTYNKATAGFCSLKPGYHDNINDNNFSHSK